MASGIVTLLASLLAGLLYDRIGPGAAFGLGAAAALLALASIPLLRPRSAAVGE
jgi:hypothetical protein